MLLDGHIHIMGNEKNQPVFRDRLKAAGVDGGIVISNPPAVFRTLTKPMSVKARLDSLFYWTKGNKNLYPFFWIDPVEKGALDQVAVAVERGVKGFKVICSRHSPGDRRCMPTYRAIAAAGKPILFHSGILWDGVPSSQNNRPAGFEAMLEVPGIRFALAHISWPWYDECLAVYGKIESSLRRRPELSCEMFIDLTPGTPEIYRRDALTKIYTIGYKIEGNIFWGSDSGTTGYNPDWVKKWLKIDKRIFQSLKLPRQTQAKAFSDNLKRFVGANKS